MRRVNIGKNRYGLFQSLREATDALNYQLTYENDRLNELVDAQDGHPYPNETVDDHNNEIDQCVNFDRVLTKLEAANAAADQIKRHLKGDKT